MSFYPESAKNFLNVPLPRFEHGGIQVTRTHWGIRTGGLLTCFAIGGAFDDGSLFQSHFFPEYHEEHLRSVRKAARKYNLHRRQGFVFLFRKSLDSIPQFTIPSRRSSSQTDYELVAEELRDGLHEIFPRSSVREVPYRSSQRRVFGKLPSGTAVIDLLEGQAFTNMSVATFNFR